MNDFDKGFEFSARHAAAVPAGMDAASWVNSVEAAIEELYSAMNSYDHYKNSKAAQDSLKGFLAEEWAFGTANVDASVKRSTPRASGSTRTTSGLRMWPGAPTSTSSSS